MGTALSEDQKLILEFLRKKEESSNRGIMKELSMQDKVVNDALNSLRELGYVIFKQDFHLSKGQLIMARITGRGTTALQEINLQAKKSSGPRKVAITDIKSDDLFKQFAKEVDSRNDTDEYEKEVLKKALTDLHLAFIKKDEKRFESVAFFLSKASPWLSLFAC